MSNKKISQLPFGDLTDNSKLIFVNNNDDAYQLPYSAFSNYFLIAFDNADTFITGGTYDNGVTTLTNNKNNSITATDYQTGYTYTLEDSSNKQNNMLQDNSNVKYPSVDAINNQNNILARISINTGFIDTNDDFIMTRLDDFTLRLSASTKGIIFKSLIENSSTIDDAILQIPLTDIPLSAIGLTVNGIYIRFIGYTDTGTIVYSNTTFELISNICQLGVLILKVTGGTTSFEDATRGVINKPDVSAYSNLEVNLLELNSNVVIIPNSGMTISNSSGSLKGISVNWHGVNNDLKPISGSVTTNFTHLSFANAISTTPPPFVTAVTTNQYWNGSALVNLSTSGAASIQRWLLTINGTIALQYGEQQYSSLFEATNNVAIANFLNILPIGTYAEIGRMVAIRDTTNLSDINQCVFYVKNNGNFTISTNTVWGEINGNINNQRDLKLALDSTLNYENQTIVNLGTATTSGNINVDLNQGKNLKVTVAVSADTKINILPRTSNINNENSIIIKIPKFYNIPITFSSTLIFDQNTQPILKNDMFTSDNFYNTFLNTGVFGYEAYGLALYPDNKMLVGGYFGGYIVKANTDGTVDNSFTTTAPDNLIFSIAIQPDNKAIVVGRFTQFNGISANRIIRLNTDGSTDTTFSAGTVGFNGPVSAVTLQTDGKIVCGGDFTTFSGVTLNRIARLNTNGTLDTSFSGVTGATGGFRDIIRTVKYDNVNNKILVGGVFNIVNNQHAENFCRLNLDGTLDTGFTANMGSGYGSIVHSIAMDSTNNRILLGGDFNGFSGLSTSYICGFNPDATKNVTFNDTTGFNRSILTMTVQPDNKIIVGGTFYKYSGYSSYALIRLNSNGTVDTGFTSSVDNGGNVAQIWSSVIQPDGKIIVGGFFYTVAGATSYGIARLNSNGSRDASFNPGSTSVPAGTTVAMKLQTDGKVLAGGNWSPAIVRLTTGGTKDAAYTGVSFAGTVYTIDTQSDGKALVGGLGTGNRHLVRANLDGSIDGTFNVGTNFNGQLYNVMVQPDGKIVCGGAFTQYSGLTANYIVRLNSDATIDNTFNTGTGFNGNVYKVLYEPSGNTILVTGIFTSYNGQPYNRVLKLNLDGSVYSGFNNTNTFDDYVYTGVIQNNGNVIVGGGFTRLNGIPQSKFSAVDYSGNITTDAVIRSGISINGPIYTISINSKQEIFIGGDFTKYNNIDVSRAYILETNLTQNRPLNMLSFNASVYASVVQPDDKLLLAGRFTAFNGISTLNGQQGNNNRLARLITGIDKTFFFNTIQDNNNNIIIK